MGQDSNKYKDIIDMKYPFNLLHPRMSTSERAAQFSAFKALLGFDEEINEAMRTTDLKMTLNDLESRMIDIKLQTIKNKIYNLEQPLVQIVYFISDVKKEGGKYVQVSEKIKKIDEVNKTVQTTTNMIIPIQDIYKIEGDLFE